MLKELAKTRAERDSLKKQLATAMANPTKLLLTDPEIIELIADARKARGAGPAFGPGDLNPKEASAIVMRGPAALPGRYDRALRRHRRPPTRGAAALCAPTVFVDNAATTSENLLFKITADDWDSVMNVRLWARP